MRRTRTGLAVIDIFHEIVAALRVLGEIYKIIGTSWTLDLGSIGGSVEDQKQDAFDKGKASAIKPAATPAGSPRLQEPKVEAHWVDILWIYSRMDTVSVVVFVCENLAIENTILGRLKYLGQPVLWNRVAVTQAEDWQKNPSDAPIRLDGRTFTLRSLRGETRPNGTAEMARTIAL